MRTLALLLAALALLGCVRETVSCTVLADDDPLCQDPDVGVVDAGPEDANAEDATAEDGGDGAVDSD